MRVVLVHNKEAGRKHHSAASLVDEIRALGHDVVATVVRKGALRRALEHDVELVAVAGGDGTVGQVAEILRGTGLPFVVVPLGTANNISASLGVREIAEWTCAERRSYDVARAHVDGELTRFIEGMGCGLFPWVIHHLLEIEEEDDRRLQRELEILARHVLAAPLKPYTIDADGADLSGEYFLVETVNIPWLGPRVAFAPDARYDDGALDLVLAGAADRVTLHAALTAGAPVVLPTRRVRRVRIEGKVRRYHRDGDLITGPVRRITIVVEPGGLHALGLP